MNILIVSVLFISEHRFFFDFFATENKKISLNLYKSIK